MTAELIQSARSGDHDAFTALVAPYRAELHLLCYRMLGSLQDAEDTLQEALLAAWLGFAGFEGRSSVRTWLHRIATNRCLNALRSVSRRPEPARGGEVVWLQPYPDLMLDDVQDHTAGPEAVYETREAVSLAFLTAVQLLPPNQRAVLLLRDVLGYRAAEVADLLGLTESAVTSALKRARATLDVARTPQRPAPVPGSEDERELMERFVAAFTSNDVDALVDLMTDDVWVRMPPLSAEYQGRVDVRRFFAAMSVCREAITRMVPTRANGQPAWAEYTQDPVTGTFHCVGVLVARFAGGRVSELTHFETVVLPYFALPRTLVARSVGGR
jgi:RNA polymerase sigma-70 factor (ECF subfamily)